MFSLPCYQIQKNIPCYFESKVQLFNLDIGCEISNFSAHKLAASQPSRLVVEFVDQENQHWIEKSKNVKSEKSIDLRVWISAHFHRPPILVLFTGKTLKPSLMATRPLSPFDKLSPSLFLRKLKLRPWIRVASSTRSVKSNPSSVRERGDVDEKEKKAENVKSKSARYTREEKSKREMCKASICRKKRQRRKKESSRQRQTAKKKSEIPFSNPSHESLSYRTNGVAEREWVRRTQELEVSRRI